MNRGNDMKKSLLVAAVMCFSGLSCDMVLGMNSQQVDRYTQQVLNQITQAHGQGNNDYAKSIIIAAESDNPGILRNLLWLAVYNNYSWLAEDIFEQYGAQIKVDDWRDDVGRTLLMQAVMDDNTDMMILLMANGASIFDADGKPILDKKGKGVVYYAVEKGGAVLDLLHLNGVDFSKPCRQLWPGGLYTIPSVEAYRGSEVAFGKMLSWKDVSERGVIGVDLLKEVIGKGNFGLFKRLIGLYGSDSIIKENGESLLMAAIFYNKLGFVKYLIGCGVDAATVNNYIGGALHYAAAYSSNLLQYLLNIPELARDIYTKKGRLGRTPLQVAISYQNVDSVKILCQRSDVAGDSLNDAIKYDRKFTTENKKINGASLEIVWYVAEAMIKQGRKPEDHIEKWLKEKNDNFSSFAYLVKRFRSSILGNISFRSWAIFEGINDSDFLECLAQYYREADYHKKASIWGSVAIYAHNSICLQYLLKSVPEVVAQNINMIYFPPWGQATALTSAVRRGDVEAVRILCQQPGIDFSIKVNVGRDGKKTALDIAKDKGYSGIVQIITDAIASQGRRK